MQAIMGLPSAVVLIDEFQVPHQPQFSFYHGPKGAGTICNLELIHPFLDERDRLLFPKYGKEEAFGLFRKQKVLVGYAVLFHNLEQKVEGFWSVPFVSRHFCEGRKTT